MRDHLYHTGHRSPHEEGGWEDDQEGDKELRAQEKSVGGRGEGEQGQEEKGKTLEEGKNNESGGGNSYLQPGKSSYCRWPMGPNTCVEVAPCGDSDRKVVNTVLKA